jgi:hypothetical protein
VRAKKKQNSFLNILKSTRLDKIENAIKVFRRLLNNNTNNT